MNNRKQVIKDTIQNLIDTFKMSYDEINDINHDYSFTYSDSEDNENDNNDDICPDCGNHYEDCCCDEDDYETDEDYENYEDEDDHINGVTSRLVLGLLINDINDIAADEFAQHEYEQFKKKPSTGGGSKPQQGL